MSEAMDREEMLAQMEHLVGLAERAYGDMFETGSPSGASGCYSEARACLSDAIHLAVELHREDRVAALRHRLLEIQAVFRSQFGS